MSTRNLDKMMTPRSVVAIGASARPGSLGEAVTRNLLAGGFQGDIHLVNIKGGEIAGRPVLKSLAELKQPADLAVIMTPPETVPRLVLELGEHGTRVAVVITAGSGEDNARWRKRILRAARPHLLRIVGPNCIGYAAPRIGLNASFGPGQLKAGRIAAVAQSGAVLAGLADWGTAQNIGFSHLISMGDMSDVDFGDVLDMLARDYDTRAVLMYVEGITQARKFMSAARSVARVKPVIVLKAGRHAAAAKAAASHTGAMAGSAAVYDAAFARAGLVRVHGLGELFDAAETLGHGGSPRNERLAILTNGGGTGIIATDLLMDEGGELASLLPRTLGVLDKALPRAWSHGNPVDIVGDADGARYAAALDALADDRGVGAVLAMNVPTALTSSVEAARAVAGAAGAKVVPVIGCWIGGPEAQAGRHVLHEAGIPAYDTPLRAVRGFMHIVQYRRGQRALQRTPPSVPQTRSDTALVRAIVAGALKQRRGVLTEPESKRVLAAYGIPVVPTEVVLDGAEAAAAALRIGFPVAVKILSRQITHKSDVGGVALDLSSEQAVLDAVRDMTGKALVLANKAKIDGFVVQPMIKRPHAIELIVGAAEDPVFGPILMVGHGGVAAEVVDDRALALPPLDPVLAEDALSRTRVDRLLRGYPRPAAGQPRRGVRRHDPPVRADRRRRRDRRARHQPVAGRRGGRDRARRAHRRASAGGAGAGGALRHKTLSGRARDRDHRSRRQEALRPADPARRRAADPGLLATADAGGRPHALLRADARADARDGGAAHPDRLRPRDGLPAARRQGAFGRRPARRRSRLRAGGVRAGRGLRPAGARLRHAAARSRAATTPRRAASSGWSATCCARTTRCSNSPSGWASSARADAPASPISGS